MPGILQFNQLNIFNQPSNISKLLKNLMVNNQPDKNIKLKDQSGHWDKNQW